jgi:hypothetical protein
VLSPVSLRNKDRFKSDSRVLGDTINNIIEESSKLFASHCTNPQLDIIQLIINPVHYAVNNSLKANTCTSIEPLCRQLIYKLHCKRYELLAKNDLLRCKRKINISV